MRRDISTFEGSWPQPVLGQLRRMLLSKAQLGEGSEPSVVDIQAWLRDVFRNNPALASTYTGIFRLKEDLQLREMDLPALNASITAMTEMERRPLPKFSFVSVTWKDQPCGLLIEKESLRDGGYVYVGTLFLPNDFGEGVVRAEFRAAKAQPEPFASLQTPERWVQFSSAHVEQVPLLAFMLRCMVGCHRYRFRQIDVRRIERADVSAYTPPDNDFLEQLLVKAYKNELTCTRAVVSMEEIEPDSIDFALAFPYDELKRVMSHFVDGGKASTELVLYQSDGRFIMGDDYPVYLTYKALLFKRVPAVILGPFQSDNVEVLEVGGSELIPPIMVSPSGSVRAKPIVADKMSLLNAKLLSLAPAKPTSDDALTKTYYEFCHLLSSRKKHERDLHRFLMAHPEMLDGHVAKVHSEVRVGSFRADLVLRYAQSDKKVVLVELEMDNVTIFNKKNRLHAKVGHASQQIEDWIAAIRSNSAEMPEWLKSSYTAEGYVVVGRSSDLTEEQRSVLFNINANRTVKILTYDDLLERLNRLITTVGRTPLQ